MKLRTGIVVCCLAVSLGSAAAHAVSIPSPPPQTAEERAPYNAALVLPEGDGSTCCTAHDTTGCDNSTCESYICSIDGFCCEVEWDFICVAEAFEFCPVCGGSIPAPVIPAASPTGLIALAAALLAAGTAMLLWRRKRAG